MRISTTTILTAAVLAVSASPSLRAAETSNAGRARISDGPASVSDADAPTVPAGSVTSHPAAVGVPCENCERGLGHHGPDHHKHGANTPLHVWLCHHGACTYSPDHGWAPPDKRPIERIPAQYRRYWPRKWYGEPGWSMAQASRFPTVYQPTDTTQLGFYYQRVPTWRPRPGMIPPPPYPPQFHSRECLDP